MLAAVEHFERLLDERVVEHRFGKHRRELTAARTRGARSQEQLCEVFEIGPRLGRMILVGAF